MEKQEIKKQVNEILNKFSKSLDSLDKKGSLKKDNQDIECIEREKQVREERVNENNEKVNSEFRKIMFKNSLNSDENFIFGEKKKW